MKQIIIFILFVIIIVGCNKEIVLNPENGSNKIIGTWKLVYGEIRENDSVKIKDMSNSEFIKIINNSHFAFFNQNSDSSDGFYGGGGTYQLKDSMYVERLEFIALRSIRGHEFSFTIEFDGDTLIQSGLEEVKEENIKRYIVEKYIRINE